MRRYITAISIALSVAAMPTIGSAVEIGVTQK